jgi:tetratricopeptide (TPR) repeat protein/DNA-binding CsgD family transcriptional regulator
MGDAHHSLGEFPVALEMMIAARTYFEHVGQSSRVANLTNTIAGAYADTGEYAKAIEEYHRNETLIAELDDPWLSIIYHNGIGLTWSELGDSERAVDHLETSFEISKREGNEYYASQTMGNIGKVVERFGDHDRALENYRAARSAAESIGDLNAAAIWTEAMGDVHLALGRHTEALAEFQHYRSLAVETGSQLQEVCALGSIGRAHVALGRGDEAMDHLQQALAAAEQGGFQRQVGMLTKEIGRLHATRTSARFDARRAEEHLLRAAELAIERGDRNDLWQVYAALSDLHRDERNSETALEYRSRAFEVYQDVVRVEAHLKAQQLDARHRIAAIEKRRAVELAEARAAMEIQRMEIEQTGRELGNATLQILAQAELLRDLRADLLKIARRIPPTEPAVRELRERIKRLPCESVDWERFDMQFKAVHPDFIRNLTERAPDLTATEVRVCTMLRMNLRSQDIAQIFCTTERGVEFHRANIRRKLGLKREEKLPFVLGAM